MEQKILISLFDYTGNSAKPFRLNGWKVIQVDIQHGVDVMLWDYKSIAELKGVKVGIIAGVPCTDYALSGARHFAAKDADGRTEQSQALVAKTKEIIDFFASSGVLAFWQLENPMSRIHKLNPWLGAPVLKFNPCDFAGWDPEPDKSRYNKMTWIWGDFKTPEFKRLEPFEKESPIWKKYGGKSLKTKNARSATPMGWAWAFYEANKNI